MNSSSKSVVVLIILIVAVSFSGCNRLSDEEQANLKKLRAIVEQVKPLVKYSQGLASFNGPIKGKCIIWWLDENRMSAAYWNRSLPENMKASPSDKEITIILYSEKDYVRGFSTHTIAIDIYVIYWPEKKFAGRFSLSEITNIGGGPGGLLPPRANGQESFIVPYIASWVAKLPKE